MEMSQTKPLSTAEKNQIMCFFLLSLLEGKKSSFTSLENEIKINKTSFCSAPRYKRDATLLLTPFFKWYMNFGCHKLHQRCIRAKKQRKKYFVSISVKIWIEIATQNKFHLRMQTHRLFCSPVFVLCIHIPLFLVISYHRRSTSDDTVFNLCYRDYVHL